MKNYSYFEVFVIALFIILFVFLFVGGFFVYYHCAFLPVIDLPGYCLSIL